MVTWPQVLLENSVLRRELARLGGDGLDQRDTGSTSSEAAAPAAQVDESTPADTGDLFDDQSEPSQAGSPVSEKRVAAAKDARALRRTLDGRLVHSVLQLRVSDWLYSANLAHAYERALPCEEALHADFYVPEVGLYIECWERDVPTDTLSRRLRVREVCRELNLAYLEVTAADVDRVDEILSHRLAELGAAR